MLLSIHVAKTKSLLPLAVYGIEKQHDQRQLTRVTTMRRNKFDLQNFGLARADELSTTLQ
jgi:hypothetical protein